MQKLNKDQEIEYHTNLFQIIDRPFFYYESVELINEYDEIRRQIGTTDWLIHPTNLYNELDVIEMELTYRN